MNKELSLKPLHDEIRNQMPKEIKIVMHDLSSSRENLQMDIIMGKLGYEWEYNFGDLTVTYRKK